MRAVQDVPFITGFCAFGGSPTSHARCPGGIAYGARSHTCTCRCHTQQRETRRCHATVRRFRTLGAAEVSWRARCVCGWHGDPRPSSATAVADGLRHNPGRPA